MMLVLVSDYDVTFHYQWFWMTLFWREHSILIPSLTPTEICQQHRYHNNNIKPHIKRSLLSILTITSARAIDATLTFRPCPHEITAFYTRQYHTLRRIHGVQIFRRCISRPASTVYRQFSGTTPTKNIYDAIHHGSSTEHFYSSQILL